MINNEFWSFVRFIKPTTDTSKNFYEPTEEVGQLIAKGGDAWRFLMPKSDFEGEPLADSTIVLVKKEWLTESSGIVGCNFPTGYKLPIGTIRKQNTENYTEAKILIGEIPDGETYRQFSLNRSNGKSVFGTFKGNQTNRYEYLKALNNHFEGCYYTNVFASVSGSLMIIRAYTNNRFRLSDEKCTIGIGSVDEKNSNTPTIESRFIENVTIPAKYRFSLSLNNIAVGNRLVLGTKSITVSKGDTVDSIKSYLLGGLDYYEVNQTDNVILSSTKGSYEIINTEKPTVQSLFQFNSGFDRYKIAVSGNYSVGNIIQITASGKTPINYTIKSTDTISSITTALNPNGSNLYYDVTSGTIISISVFEGVQTIDNNNNLTFALNNRTSIASKTVSRYQCYIGDDVQLRNYFKVHDKEYYAKIGDTPLDVAIGLGYATRQFTVEIPTTTTLIAYALQGAKYGDENIADVKIIQQPKIKLSSQYVCEVVFPTEINGTTLTGEYYLAVWSEGRERIMAIGNSVRFTNTILRETSMVEFFDNGIVFNHEYIEDGLTQRLRLPIMLTQPKRQIEENRVMTINGGIERTETNIMEYRSFVTRGIPNGMMRALQVTLRHKGLVIDNERYTTEGEVSDDYVDDYVNYGQNTGKLLRFGKNSNNANQLIANELYKGFGRIIVNSTKSDLRVLIIDDSFGLDSNSKKEVLVEDSVLIATGEYQIVIDNPAGDVGLNVFQDDILQRKILVVGNSRSRLNGFQRLNSGGTIKLEFFDTKLIGTINFEKEQILSTPTNVIYKSEIKPSESIGDLGNDFGTDFN